MLAGTQDDRQKENIKLASYTLDHWIIMDALILVAGEGTRLLPLTQKDPNPFPTIKTWSAETSGSSEPSVAPQKA
jgi:hypothetical protein